MPLALSWEPPPPAPPPPDGHARVAAFFDLDDTLLRGAVGGYLFREMRQRGLVPRLKLLMALGYRLLFTANLASGDDIYRFGYRLLAGMTLDEAKALTEAVMERILRNLWGEGVAALEEHREKGHLVAVVTGAPEYGAYLVCKHLRVEHLLCTPTPIAGGRLGVDVDVKRMCYGAGKARLLAEFARTWGIDLGQSYAYADSASDIPFLAAVGNARAVNPQWLMEREARRNGWQVLRFTRRVSDATSAPVSHSPRGPTNP